MISLKEQLLNALVKLENKEINEVHIFDFQNSLNDYKIIMKSDHSFGYSKYFYVTVTNKVFFDKEFFDSSYADKTSVQYRFYYLTDNWHNGGKQSAIILEGDVDTLENKFKMYMWQLKLGQLNEVNIYIRDYNMEYPNEKDAYKFHYIGNNMYQVFGVCCPKNWRHDDVYEADNYQDLGNGYLEDIYEMLNKSYGVNRYKFIDISGVINLH